MNTIATLVLLMMTTQTAFAGSAALTALPDNLTGRTLQMVGEGEFRFIGFHLYDASYWAGDDGGQALKIVYRKNIPGKALNNQMLSEWKRLRSATESQRASWAEQTAEIWPDVSPGSALIAVVNPGTDTEFFDGSGNRLGQIRDPEFGPAFLDIWLDPRTRARKLRMALIGNDRRSDG